MTTMTHGLAAEDWSTESRGVADWAAAGSGEPSAAAATAMHINCRCQDIEWFLAQ